MDVDDLIEIILGHLVKHPVAQDPRVVHQDVKLAKGVERALHERLSRGHRADGIGVDCRLAASLGDLVSNGFGGGFVDVVHEDASALSGERERHGTADAAAGSGDYTGSSAQAICHAAHRNHQT
jgi:hypothetical protein